MRRALYILTLSVALAVGSVSVTMVAGDGDTTFNIYSITGQLIKTVRVNAGTRVTIDMPKGFYIVKCAGRWSRKVVVK